ncbi:hypothetical protein [Paenibacillus sp. J22TS3]|uniref:hypothetical protein n=1 Tax=Paenibacillus sp. J22TS3 TaxID=2807192 RepID=UPI001B0FFCF7|nr:hypothetical protein [Paenibacillus sp. J22TS3]GIP24861.1 hypothetical protein J22TS3_51360 [Paenibacillus sp. J22TS3]
MSVEPNSQATFYQYKLLKKVIFPRPFVVTFLLLPLFCVLTTIIAIHWTSVFSFVLAFPVILWFQLAISRAVLIIVIHSHRKRWEISYKLPWIGYVPDQHVSYRTFLKVQLHTTWIGLCLIAILFPWSPLSFAVNMIFWHVWIMLPRYYGFLLLWRQPKGGMVKLNEQDISYYMP